MLYPITNLRRTVLQLDPLWKFRADPDKRGEKEEWFKDFESDTDVAIPGSWNEQLEELGMLFYVGTAWYSKRFFLPLHFEAKRSWFRIGSADFSAKVWVNGRPVGESEFGFLPYEFEITKFMKPGEENLVAVAVSNELGDDSIPQGITPEHYSNENRIREETNPPARFDFSPFGGIHRPVIIYSAPSSCFVNLKVDTRVRDRSTGEVEVAAEVDGDDYDSFRLELIDEEGKVVSSSNIEQKGLHYKLRVDNCRFWSAGDPYLYTLKAHLTKGREPIDEYSMKIGIREVTIVDGKLLLNGQEIFLKGFGKHEDFSVIGKGLFPPLMVKDFQLMKWVNSNSFRTSHYPYAEEVLQYADKKGLFIISEAPAVSLDLRYVSPALLSNHKEFVRRMIERDYNHPSVIIWSIGNEPNLTGDQGYFDGSGRSYWKEVFDFTRGLDTSRPITVPNCSRAGLNDPVFEFSDILSINRYYGWYEYPGNLELAVEKLSAEMKELHDRYNKPVLVTEFGADSLAGTHSNSLQMFTEEYQAKLIEKYIECIESAPFTIGELVWNFADFRTPQNFRRVVLNLKGVFTRTREPKAAAFKLKEIWSSPRKIRR